MLTRRVLVTILWTFLFGTFCKLTGASGPIAGRYGDLYLAAPHRAAEIDSAVGRARAQLIGLLQDSLTYRPQIHVVGGRHSFDSLLGGAFPDWGAAAALPHKGLIVIKSPDHFRLERPLAELLTHEYAHLALEHRIGRREVPRWFQEGVAQMVSMEWDYWDNLAATRVAVFDQFFPLWEIERVNRFGSARAQIAYGLSYRAVAYMYDAYGVEAVNVFMDRLRAGFDPDGTQPPRKRARPSVSPLIDQALLESVGSDYVDFQEELFRHWRSRYSVGVLFMDTWFLWLGLALVVVVGAILKFRSRREYYRKWEEEERLGSTDFDYGDPNNPEQTDDDEPWRE